MEQNVLVSRMPWIWLLSQMVRECRKLGVEWGFGKIIDLWAFLDFSKNLQMLSSPIATYYSVMAFLTNYHTCLYGGQTSQVFTVHHRHWRNICCKLLISIFRYQIKLQKINFNLKSILLSASQIFRKFINFSGGNWTVFLKNGKKNKKVSCRSK